MTTMVLADYCEPVSIKTHPRVVIREAIADFCDLIRHPEIADKAVSVALTHRVRFNVSTASTIAFGQAQVRLSLRDEPESAA